MDIDGKKSFLLSNPSFELASIPGQDSLRFTQGQLTEVLSLTESQEFKRGGH